MRPIGSIPAEAHARLFGDFLLSRGIQNEIEQERDNTWSVWIREEDQVPVAQTLLAQFKADPKAPEFQKASDEAARVREAHARDLEEYQRRVRTRKSLFPRLGGYGVGVLTYLLIVVCVAIALYSKLGEENSVVFPLCISDPELRSDRFLPEVFDGEIWRLFTPMLVHFGPIHLLFNMMWLYQLGCMIEARRGSGAFLLLVLAFDLSSNLAQYYFTKNPAFGGMSGVVYGLAGYIWMRGKYDRASGLYLHPQSITILLIWLVICFAGVIPHVANMAHLGGLVAGMVWGRLSAFHQSQKPEE